MQCLVILLLSVVVALASDEAALEEFAKANNLFAASVFKEIIKDKNENVLVSPYSAEAVLAFAQSGCKGNTAQELRNALHLPDDKEKVEAGVQASIPLLTGNNLYTLHTANKMYVKEDFTIKDGFKKSAVEVYGADIEPIDFGKKVEAAGTMNEWVEEKTNNKIQNLISPDILDANTKTILINALYFKANWSKQFVKELTQPQDFYKTANDIVKLDMMHQYKQWYNYYESSELDAKFLELPFLGDDVSMVVILPNEKEGLKALENQIDKVFLPQTLQREFVNVALPKFKIESTIPFIPILNKLGVHSAFENTADLSGIAGNPGDLVISDVLQKTFIDVLEGGVEAAAATYVGVSFTSALIRPTEPEPKNFIADHPFMFYIKAKNFIIFAGRVVVPSH